MKKTHTWLGLAGLAVALSGCIIGGDDSGTTTINTTVDPTVTTTDNTTGDPPATDGEESTGDPPATSSTGSAEDTTTTDGVVCDPPCEPGQECIDGICFDVGCDPPCDPATEQCVMGACEPLPGGSDYGGCAMGCPAGEMPVSIEGIEGCFCSPMCGEGMPCPPPNEGTATAMCVLTFNPMDPPSQCALICAGDMDCPTGATCTDVGGGSICMHPM